MIAEVTHDHPFNVLLDIARRSRSHSQGLPEQVDVKNDWSGIGFLLGEMHLVAAMSDISEILSIPSLTPLPGVQSWVKGVANVRGRLLPIIDFGQFLDVQRQPSTGKRGIIVVEVGELYCGLIVDQIFGMKHFPIDALADNSNDFLAESMCSFVEGTYVEDNNQAWSIFQPDLLLENESFMNASLEEQSTN